jgi:hypothetical protein
MTYQCVIKRKHIDPHLIMDALKYRLDYHQGTDKSICRWKGEVLGWANCTGRGAFLVTEYLFILFDFQSI